MKYFDTLIEDQETTISILYQEQIIRIYSSEPKTIQKLTKVLGKPTVKYKKSKTYWSGASWDVSFFDNEKLVEILYRDTFIDKKVKPVEKQEKKGKSKAKKEKIEEKTKVKAKNEVAEKKTKVKAKNEIIENKIKLEVKLKSEVKKPKAKNVIEKIEKKAISEIKEKKQIKKKNEKINANFEQIEFLF